MKTKQIPYITWLLIAANLIYFLIVEFTGTSEDTMHMINMGACYSPLVIYKGEYWRLIAAIFMHYGVDHIGGNMLMLFLIGDNLEKALGRIKYFILYMLSGIFANVASCFVEQLSPSFPYNAAASVGASGAIFGVVGGLLWAVIINKGSLDDITAPELIKIIIITLIYGFVSTGINNTAHIAGCISGFLISMILYRRPKSILT